MTPYLRRFQSLQETGGGSRCFPPQLVSRIHRLLLELIPGGAKKYLTRGQAGHVLRTMPVPADLVAQTRHQLACELVEELTMMDAKIKGFRKKG